MSVGEVTAARKRLERKVKEYQVKCALMGNGRNGAKVKGERNGGAGLGKVGWG